MPFNQCKHQKRFTANKLLLSHHSQWVGFDAGLCTLRDCNRNTNRTTGKWECAHIVRWMRTRRDTCVVAHAQNNSFAIWCVIISLGSRAHRWFACFCRYLSLPTWFSITISHFWDLFYIIFMRTSVSCLWIENGKRVPGILSAFGAH